MKIGELARRAGVAPSKIRFLEARGVLRADRLANGYRDYGEEAFANLQIILQAQSVGFTLKEIERAVLENGSQQLDCADILERLKAKLIELDQHIAQSTSVRDQLVRMIAVLSERGTDNQNASGDPPVHGAIESMRPLAST